MLITYAGLLGLIAVNVVCAASWISPGTTSGKDVRYKTSSSRCQKAYPFLRRPYKLSAVHSMAGYHDNTIVTSIQTLGSNVLHCSGQGWVMYEVSSRQLFNKIKPLYRVCQDTNTMRTKFSYRLSSSVPLKQWPEPIFHVFTWGFEGFGKTTAEQKELARGYDQEFQQCRMTEAFPDKYNAGNKYPYYFNRGHLTANVDFNEDADQKATKLYINAMPQWEVLNTLSWTVVERRTQALLKSNPEDWDIYTGSYGVMASSRGTPIYLSPMYDSSGNFVKDQLPLPLAIWKLAYNNKNKAKSQVYIGINNPKFENEKDIDPEYIFCTPIRVGKDPLFKGSAKKGFYYECEVQQFLTNINKVEKIVNV